MSIKTSIILSILYFGLHQLAWCNYPDDPLRGPSFNYAYAKSTQVLLLKIDQASHGVPNSECEYKYEATLIHDYKSIGDRSNGIHTQIQILTTSRFKVDDEVLIFRDFAKLDFRVGHHLDCKAGNSKIFSPNSFVVHDTESLKLFSEQGKKFVFLPYRYFWSGQDSVTVRESKIPVDQEMYSMLRTADGCLNGKFYDFDALVQEASQQEGKR